MNKPQDRNIAENFRMIHNIITRALRVSIESIQEFSQPGFKKTVSLPGLYNYMQALTSVLNAHHLTEDEIAFPYFRDKLPEVPFDSLTKMHQVMVLVLDKINLALEKGEKDGQYETELGNLQNAMTRFTAMWHPHIKIETDEFLSKADALIPVEEQLRLVGLFGQHGQKLAVPPFLTVPFMLYNLPPEDRTEFSRGMPLEVIQHLVPVVWKNQWKSMTPFFLT